jgi:hypothetical protein
MRPTSGRHQSHPDLPARAGRLDVHLDMAGAERDPSDPGPSRGSAPPRTRPATRELPEHLACGDLRATSRCRLAVRHQDAHLGQAMAGSRRRGGAETVGFRLRKSFKLALRVRMTMTPGIGVSAGSRGAKFSVHSSERVTQTLNLPGSGISHTDTLRPSAHCPAVPTSPSRMEYRRRSVE